MPPPARVVIIPVVAFTRRILPLPASAIYTFPAESTATLLAVLRIAPEPVPLWTPSPVWPFPATVVIVPDGVTLRTRLAVGSAMYRLAEESTATDEGLFRRDWMDGPPSPTEVTVPANVVMAPPTANRRTRPLLRSAT